MEFGRQSCFTAEARRRGENTIRSSPRRHGGTDDQVIWQLIGDLLLKSFLGKPKTASTIEVFSGSFHSHSARRARLALRSGWHSSKSSMAKRTWFQPRAAEPIPRPYSRAEDNARSCTGPRNDKTMRLLRSGD